MAPAKKPRKAPAQRFKIARKKSESSVDFCSAIFDGVRIGLASVSETGRVCRANRRFAEMLGLQVADGADLKDCIADNGGWDAFKVALSQALQLPMTAQIKLRRQTATSPLWLSLSPGRSEREVFVAAVATADLLETSDALKKSRAAVRSLSARILQLQDEERRRIARDLHDVTGQELAAAKIFIQNIASSRDASPEELQQSLNEAANLIGKVSDEVRTLCYLMHPPLLDVSGIGPALGWYVDGLSKRSGLEVHLDAKAELQRFGEDNEIALFRVVQESLTNVLRHSGSRRVWIRCTVADGKAQLSIRDEGKGIDPQYLAKLNGGGEATGVGLPGMRERLMQLGGHFRVESSGDGTTITAMLPVAPPLAEPPSPHRQGYVQPNDMAPPKAAKPGPLPKKHTA